eukprot:7376330-Prymnesium_polylepis.3
MKKVIAPFVFKDDRQIRAMLTELLGDFTMFVGDEETDGINGAAWSLTELLTEVLEQCADDQNLKELPDGVMRTVQLMYDAMGWTSRNGLTCMVLRCVQTIRNHNNPRYGATSTATSARTSTRPLSGRCRWAATRSQ